MDWARTNEFDLMYGVYNTSYGYQPWSTLDYLEILSNRDDMNNVATKFVESRQAVKKEIDAIGNSSQQLPRVNTKLNTTQAQTSGGKLFRVKRKTKYL
jgi:hypothetical protein